MFTKLFVPALALVIAMSSASSATKAAEGSAEATETVSTQESGKKKAEHIDAKVASACYHACKRLAEFDHSGSKPLKPTMAAA